MKINKQNKTKFSFDIRHCVPGRHYLCVFCHNRFDQKHIQLPIMQKIANLTRSHKYTNTHTQKRQII